LNCSGVHLFWISVARQVQNRASFPAAAHRRANWMPHPSGHVGATSAFGGVTELDVVAQPATAIIIAATAPMDLASTAMPPLCFTAA
jgi:hypothetical protein